MSTAVAKGVAAARLSREAKIGLGALGAVVAIRVVGGNFVANEWEGWGTFLAVSTAMVIEGLILWGLIFGLVVRLGARGRGLLPGLGAVIVGGLAALSLAIPYSAPQAVLGAGAVALGLVALDRAERPVSRHVGMAAIVLGAVVIAAWLVLVAITFATGDWPDITP